MIAKAKARHPEFADRFFNVGFLIEPRGRDRDPPHHKVVPLQPVEHSVTPHNVWDRWIELYGAKLESFYPVADTEIGRIGIMMANEASYPENARGLAMNGCEIAYRGPYPGPRCDERHVLRAEPCPRARQQHVRDRDEPRHLLPRPRLDVPIDTFSGGSQIVDFRGQVMTEVPYGGGSTWIAGTIDIEALRHFRQTAQWDNWLKDLTTEQYQLIYEQPDLSEEPLPGPARRSTTTISRERHEKQVALLQKLGIWRAPTRAAAPAESSKSGGSRAD